MKMYFRGLENLFFFLEIGVLLENIQRCDTYKCWDIVPAVTPPPSPPPPDKEVSIYTLGISRIVYCQQLILPTRLLSKWLYGKRETTDQVFKCKYAAWFVHHQKWQHKTENLQISSWNLLPSVQIQTAAPLRVILVSYYRWVNGPYPSLLSHLFSWLYGPCSTGTLRLLPDPVAHIPRTHSTGPPGSIHFMPFTRQGHKSLSFILSASLPMYTISICLMCAVPFAVPVMSISVRRCFVCISSLRSSFHISSFPSFFLVPPVPPLSHLSLLPPYLSLPPPHLFTRRLFFFPESPNVLYWCRVQFIANTFLMVEV